MRRMILGVLMGLAILSVLFMRVDVRRLGGVFFEVSLPLLIVGLVLRVFVIWIKSVRWSGVIHRATGHPVRRAFSALTIGFAGNILLPLRLGEVARTTVIDKHNQTGRSLALSTIAVTYLLDLAFLLSVFALLSFQLWSVPFLPKSVFGVLALASAAVVGSLVLLRGRSKLWGPSLYSGGRFLPAGLSRRVAKYAELFSKGFGVLRHGGALSRFLMLTVVIWGFEATAVYLMLLAFRIEASVLMAATLLVVVNLSFVFPISPGNVGVVQALSVLVLGTYGVIQEAALAYSIGTQGISYLVIVFLGAVYFYREGMNFGVIRRLAREEDGGLAGVSLET